ncbi:hypothetical protein OCAE111667_07845 [Occultella aeris]|uniref:DUF2975 domain-containing protein n=1 Tax=Occultella aeris TaxID=2761496 RepID=A0A7M4DP55_9MICO|nr:hypothetical protein [Occultella aeris]VZO39241.1 hypothetical protein HALOF300_03937 [Occultella aeris]
MSKGRKSGDPRSEATRLAIGFIRWLAILGGVVAVVQFVAIVRGRSWSSNSADPPLEIQYLPQITMAQPGAGNSMTAVDLSWWIRLSAALPGLLQAVLLLLAALLLVRILRAIAAHRSFGPEVRRDLSGISLLLILGGVAMALLDLLAVVLLTQTFYPLDGRVWERFGIELPSVPVFLIALGFVASAFMYAIRDGADLEKEAVGVV